MQKIGKYDLKLFGGSDKFRRADINENTQAISDYLDKNDVDKAEADLRAEKRVLRVEAELQRKSRGVANLHVWKAKADQESSIMEYGEAEFVTLLDISTFSADGEERPLPGKALVWYADNVYDNADAAVLADPVSSLEVDYQNPDAAAEVLRNRFFTVDGDTKVYFGLMGSAVSSVSSLQTDGSNTHTWVVRYGAQPVTPGKETVAKDEYVVSEIEDSHRTSEYEYCGKLGCGLFYKTGSFTTVADDNDGDSDYEGPDIYIDIGFKPIMFGFRGHTDNQAPIWSFGPHMEQTFYLTFYNDGTRVRVDDRALEHDSTYDWFALGYR